MVSPHPMNGYEKTAASIEELATALRRLPEEKRIVLCHGVFDLLHIGHIRYLEQARSFGDILVVTITPDRFVDKGPHRPAFPEQLRAEAVASLSCVDHVAINQWPTAEQTLRQLKPHVYVKGMEFKDTSDDPTGKIAGEAKVCEELGIAIRFTGDIVFSSSHLINTYHSNLPQEVDDYIRVFRRRNSLDDIRTVLDRMADLKVLVLGDAIMDAYQYCEAIGKSSKDPTLVVRRQSEDIFAGGVLAVANHVAGFTDQVDLLTVLGAQESYERMIRSSLHTNVTPLFLFSPEAPTMLKRRFVDGYSLNKLLEIYVCGDDTLPENVACQLRSLLKERIAGYDLVICADFGHGAISRETALLLAEHAPFLAVNTQANAGNRGFHVITRYPRMDYGCIARHELDLESRDRNGPVRPHMDRLLRQLGCRCFTVTLGRKGCAVSDCDDGFIVVPSFARKIVDRVGAGDALFALTSLAACLGVEGELLAFLGNVAGSLAVEVIGNKKPVNREAALKYITALMK